jgi:hypothetical protein
VWRLYPRTVVHRPRASTPVVQVGAQCCTAIDGVSPDQDASTDHDSPHIPPHPFCAPDPLVVFRTLRRRFEAPGYLCQPACCIAIAAGIEGRVHSVSIQWRSTPKQSKSSSDCVSWVSSTHRVTGSRSRGRWLAFLPRYRRDRANSIWRSARTWYLSAEGCMLSSRNVHLQ